ncbi:MAG: phosphatase PAP2 family protein [Gammaproteobacteria bacterium]|nr:phosphatase PAP2 family protein [Gammaproteobacteria bacterium]
MKQQLARIVLGVLVLSASGCATWSDRPQAGPNASRFQRIRLAAVNAARDPATWIPAAGAVAFRMGDLDERVSDWAYEHTPIFGSPEDANQASTDLRAVACAAAILTPLSIPPPADSARAGMTKTQGVSGGLAATLTNSALVGFMKKETDETRPNGGHSSFPSSHTSQAFACAISASRSLESVPMSAGMRKALRINLTAVAAATAWGRIEAYHHYPSDTLAGAALGNFLANFIFDAFLKPANASEEQGAKADVSLDLVDDATWLKFTWGF